VEKLDIPQTYDLGFSLSPKLPWSPLKLIISAEVEDLLSAVKVTDPVTGLPEVRSLTQRSHLGAELGFWEVATGNHVLNVRVGSNRGQPTYGYEINLWNGLRLEYIRYKDDLGTAKHPEVHTFDAVHLGLGFGF
jgi:hypothetical protein